MPVLALSQNAEEVQSATEASFRLVGVVNSGQRSMALIEVPGLEEQVLVGEGDLVSGYTLSSLMPDRVDLINGEDTLSLTVRNMRWIKADPEVKIYTREYAGANPERPRDSVQVASVQKIPASPTKKAVEVRPDFIRPMGGRITSEFGRRQAFKTSTGMYSSTYHEGIDIAAPHGTRVKAAADGVVTDSGYALHRGRYVIIQHSGGYSTRYYHLYRRNVTRGQQVKAGDTIGLEGSTGNSTGAHLHFEIRKDGTPLDPARFIPSLKR